MGGEPRIPEEFENLPVRNNEIISTNQLISGETERRKTFEPLRNHPVKNAEIKTLKKILKKKLISSSC